MATVELKEGEKIYSESEIEALFQQLEKSQTELRAEREKNRKNTVLIQQSIRVVNGVNKLIPGLANGQGLAGFNIMNLMQGDALKALQPDFDRLSALIESYKKENPVVQ